jgi:hypothetical protein
MLALNSIEDETPENFLLMSDSKKSNPIFPIIIFLGGSSIPLQTSINLEKRSMLGTVDTFMTLD